MTHDTLLRKFVRQPPTTPIIQSLRDEEHRRALAHLGNGECILDVASESNVTTGIEAKSIARVDFSPDASEYAKEVIGNDVERYQSTTPESPVLPFEDDTFDSAVSIGPYDWKFLDIETLTAELHRVLGSDGQFTFSVPTPRSPYADSGGNDNRYYEPTEALSLISSDWQPCDIDLIFQYPYYIHMGINTLSNQFQKPFVAFARYMSDRLTDHNLRKYASYLVLSAKPLPYQDKE